MKANLPTCQEITATLQSLKEMKAEFDIAVKAADKIIVKSKIENALAEFAPYSYDLDILLRKVLAERHNFLEVGRFNQQGTAVAKNQRQEFVLIDTNGKEITKLGIGIVAIGEWSEEGIATIHFQTDDDDTTTNHWCNYLKSNGDLLIDEDIHNHPDTVASFGDGFGAVTNKVGFSYLVDADGHFADFGEFDKPIEGSIKGYSEGIAAIHNSNKTILVDRSGRPINVDFPISNIPIFSDGLICISTLVQPSDYHMTYYDHDLKPVLGPYKKATDFKNGKAWVSSSEEDDGGPLTWLCIDKTGKTLKTLKLPGFIAPPEFGEEGFARGMHVSGVTVRMVDEDGIDIRDLCGLPQDMEIFGDFVGGLLSVKIGGENCKIDKHGKVIFKGVV